VELRESALEHVVVNPAFWSGKKVLVTGHTGFKGSWLSVWLQSLGAELVGYSIGIPTSPSLFELAAVEDGMVSVEGDVRDGAALEALVERERPEIVFHLAAQAIVRRSYRDPVETYETNVLGTVHLFEAVRHANSVRVVVNVTSDKCYEEREGAPPYREEDPKGGRDPYSSSKACAELVSSAYRHSFFSVGPPGIEQTSLASVRAGNVIGGGDWAEDRLIPDLMRAALSGEPAVIRSPNSVRPWQHVLSPLSGYLLLAERLWTDKAYAEAWNFGPDESEARTVRWLVDRIRSLWGDDLQVEIEQDGGHPPEARFLELDSSKARSRLGWSPGWDLEQAVASLVEWYSAQAEERASRDLLLSQIEAFQKG
jgi:CDP-glucose 4,6-dehydratase